MIPTKRKVFDILDTALSRGYAWALTEDADFLVKVMSWPGVPSSVSNARLANYIREWRMTQ